MHKDLMQYVVEIIHLILMHIRPVIRMDINARKEKKGLPIQYKMNTLEALKATGYSSYRIRREALINQSALTRLRAGKMITWDQLTRMCALLDCQPGDILEYVREPRESTAQTL